MLKHVYPPWHKPAQRILFLIGAILLITLPAIYGTTDALSDHALALVLALYFGFWLIFSLVVRFAVPSPQVESTLPTYTHAPAPTPVLHSPNKDAIPVAPAIRIHTTGSEPTLFLSDDHRGTMTQHHAPRKSARFASIDDKRGAVQDDDFDDTEYDKGSCKMDEYNDDVDIDRDTSPNSKKPTTLNVTFAHTGRPHNPRMDSNTSDTYPTYAAYRQAQHGNFDAISQKIKRAFLAAATVRPTSEPSPMAASDTAKENVQFSSLSASDNQLYPSAAGVGSVASPSSLGGNGTTRGSGRARSTSAASVLLGDIAEKIKSGSLLLGRSLTRSNSQHGGARGLQGSLDTSNSSTAMSTMAPHKPRSRAVSDAGAFPMAYSNSNSVGPHNPNETESVDATRGIIRARW